MIVIDEQKESLSERVKQQVIQGVSFSFSSSDLEKTKQREAFRTLVCPYPEKISGPQ